MPCSSAWARIQRSDMMLIVGDTPPVRPEPVEGPSCPVRKRKKGASTSSARTVLHGLRPRHVPVDRAFDAAQPPEVGDLPEAPGPGSEAGLDDQAAQPERPPHP